MGAVASFLGIGGVVLGIYISRRRRSRSNPEAASRLKIMRELLATKPCNLAEYASALCDSGYDGLDDLSTRNAQQLSQIARSVGMPPGHEGRFVIAVQQV